MKVLEQLAVDCSEKRDFDSFVQFICGAGTWNLNDWTPQWTSVRKVGHRAVEHKPSFARSVGDGPPAKDNNVKELLEKLNQIKIPGCA